MLSYFKKFLVFIFFASFVYLCSLTLWANIPYSYIGSNFLYRQGSYGHLNTRLKEIPEYGEVDILFVGSSRVYRGFDPRIFKENGLKVFVLGSSSQTPLHSYILLNRYLKVLNPKLVVFDLLPNTFANKGVEPTLDLLANDRIDQLSFEMAFEQNDLMVWNTMIYASIMNVIGKHNDFEEPIHKPKDHDTYIKGGYVHKDSSFQKEVEICEKEKSMKWHEPLDVQLNYFKKMISLLDRNNQKFVFVNMPIAHFHCYSNNDILKAYIPESVPYLDFNRLLDFHDSTDFYDEYHLNEGGVDKLDEYFINEFYNLKPN
ncbi:hypothetical protein [Psychroflexus sp. MES1-P1E]|uniref:hypothetical protein n=1 Tax=Psychroflexus sp. MES1-P1E TaxID=2058320 RepID=UPI000C7AE0A5|nr:hypothetical protein [Psychroflexus sp. MES1-P1E]PKG43436.1 hypothetical protein CXF67_05060 [Psychroflexus sp. MES1-P1E]